MDNYTEALCECGARFYGTPTELEQWWKHHECRRDTDGNVVRWPGSEVLG